MKKLFIISTILLLFISCEKVLDLDLPEPEEMIVVEGWIENGQPPIVILTRNAPFFGGFALNDLESYLVNDAVVRVSDGFQEVILPEVCINDLPEPIREILADELGFELDENGELEYNICIYTVDFLTPGFMIGEERRTYTLSVEAEGKSLSAVTTIPGLTPVDSIYLQEHPDEEVDSLIRLMVNYTDPDTIGNYIRYFTRQNSESFYPGLNSVFDDNFINGQSFFFPLDRGQSRSADFDLDTYGYFWKGDTIILKWCALDKTHYDFWSTLEYDAGTPGPFATATDIAGNIEGGLGIWGGYAASYDTIIAPPF